MLRVGLLVPPSFANLSFAPLAVFDAANLMLGEVYYEQHVVSVSGGSVTNSFGMAVQTERAEDVPLDTLLVGAPPDAREPAPDIVEYLQSSCGKTRRLASFDRGAIAAAKNLVNQVSLPSADRLLDALNSFQTALTWTETQQRIQALLKRGLQSDGDFELQWPALLGTLLET
jgi:hypothetical protein